MQRLRDDPILGRSERSPMRIHAEQTNEYELTIFVGGAPLYTLPSHTGNAPIDPDVALAKAGLERVEDWGKGVDGVKVPSARVAVVPDPTNQEA
jgi:hypothetical protein